MSEEDHPAYCIDGDRYKHLSFDNAAVFDCEILPPKELTDSEFISIVNQQGFTPIASTLRRNKDHIYVYSIEGVWLRGEL